MEGNEIMNCNEDVEIETMNEETEESGKGFMSGAIIGGLVALGSAAAYKLVIKPIVKKFKANKQEAEVDAKRTVINVDAREVDDEEDNSEEESENK